MKRILMAVVATAAVGVVAPSMAATGASAASASASAPQNPAVLRMVPKVVLVNQPASKVCVGSRFTVGVWYQSFSGGSRAYRIAVYNPKGWLVFWTKGYASSTAWRFWHIRAWRTGTFRTVYHTKNSSGDWIKYVAYTRSRYC
jgi:hypothetical protein